MARIRKPMTSGRIRLPRIGSRYLIIRGAYKGRLCFVRQLVTGGKEAVYVAELCDCWGGPTKNQVVVRLVEIEP
jgi:hypothetical protein